jgi:hypothetical protein
MTKYVLLKQNIPGKTFDMFRSNGYDILQLVETDAQVNLPADALERLLRQKVTDTAVEHTLNKKSTHEIQAKRY